MYDQSDLSSLYVLCLSSCTLIVHQIVISLLKPIDLTSQSPFESCSEPSVRLALTISLYPLGRSVRSYGGPTSRTLMLSPLGIRQNNQTRAIAANLFYEIILKLFRKSRLFFFFSFPPSFIFKEGSLENIDLEIQEIRKLKKPRIRGTNTYQKYTKCGLVY